MVALVHCQYICCSDDHVNLSVVLHLLICFIETKYIRIQGTKPVIILTQSADFFTLKQFGVGFNASK